MNSDPTPHSIPGRVQLMAGVGGLPKLRITSDVSEAEVYLNGATVTHFQRKFEPPILFVSKESRFVEGQPIRGGIPVIFPWFGAREGGAAHGFARIANWRCTEVSILPPHGEVSLRFSMPPSPQSLECPPFLLNYVVTVGKTLRLELITTHAGASGTLEFEECLHTYFQVGAIDGVEVSGLVDASYLDKMDGFKTKREMSDAIRITSETDRVYQGTESTVEIRDGSMGRTIQVSKRGSKSTVLWNPWIAKSKALADFGDEEYQRMVCVESGNVGEHRVRLEPGSSSKLEVEIA